MSDDETTEFVFDLCCHCHEALSLSSGVPATSLPPRPRIGVAPELFENGRKFSCMVRVGAVLRHVGVHDACLELSGGAGEVLALAPRWHRTRIDHDEVTVSSGACWDSTCR